MAPNGGEGAARSLAYVLQHTNPDLGKANMIRQIISITCDWCEETEQSDLSIQETIENRVKDGWIMLDGRDFCSEVCREKDRAQRLTRVA